MRQRHRTEAGTVAVVATISMTMLFAFGAVAVDLGNAFARQRDLQSQADLAALAGAADLNGSNTYSATDAAVIAVADYLNANQPQDDDGYTLVNPAQLVDDPDHTRDGDTAEQNGEVYFLPGDRMRVVTPEALVRFGLAGAIGFSDVTLSSSAAVRIRSGGAVLPFFAVDGCDYGLQTISSPPPPAASTVDVADVPSPWNAPGLADVTNPATVDLNESPAPLIEITGSDLAATTQVGFFRNDDTTFYSVAPAVVTSTTLSVQVPTDVLAIEEPWFIRVFNGTKWSPGNADDMSLLIIGASVLECSGAPSDGNFGTLRLPRTDAGPDDWLSWNIAKGLQDQLSLDTHDSATGPDWTCIGGDNDAIRSNLPNPGLQQKTNCVDTDTGLPNNVATEGFITGSAGLAARLDADTTDDCGTIVGGRDDRWNTGIDRPGPGFDPYEINDDLLTCFLADDSTPLSTVTNDGYTGDAVFTQDIYYSPRFFYMPVLGIEPTSGGSCCYSIVDFRAGFITDQPLDATRSSMEEGTSTNNGFVVDGGNVKTVKVIFFNTEALPPPPEDAPDFAYMGAGPKLIRLID